MHETVLIVDPQASLHNQEKAMWLRLEGFQTVCISHLEKAVDWVRAHSKPVPDAIIIDTRCGMQATYNAMLALKALQPALSIVVMVEYGEDVQGMAAIDMGANEYLCKPVTSNRLRQTLRQVIRFQRVILPQQDRHHSFLDEQGQMKKLHVIEQEAIRFALTQANGCMSRAARALGIGRSTLYRKMEAFSNAHEKTHQISRASHTTRPMIISSSNERS